MRRVYLGSGPGEGDAPGSLRLEVESLRQRVEKLEAMIYGRGVLSSRAPTK